MKTICPFHAVITDADKADLEQFAKQDGMQRGLFFSTSGKLCSGFVSATSQHSWLFKTTNGQPYHWDSPHEGKLGTVPIAGA